MRSSPQALRESSSLACVILCHCSAVQAGESVKIDIGDPAEVCCECTGDAMNCTV